jgi:hypothetical protein
MRTKICIPLLAGLLFFAFSTAEASIQWGSGQTADQFNYQVYDSGSYVNYSQQQLTGLSANQQVTNLGGGSGQENQTATATESKTGLSMTSGAWGQQLTNGASVSTYSNATLALDNTNQGVALAGQNTLAFINRTLTVNTTGVYTLSASALAPINWGGTTTGTATTSLGYNGAVTLTEYDTVGGGATALSTWTLSLTDLLNPNSAHYISNITLRPTDSLGNAIYYTLNVGITGNPGPGTAAQFNNYNMNTFSFLGTINGTFNAGTAANPITISASLSAVPIPGSVVLLISGLGSLVVLRRKRA